ncbi:MAG: DUF3006 domain-containing protein [Tissierella sp.]|uniref:DUF3006 domain-containing protein n=1 Tax=Tissierella sp. TaxID=41274 RepID=UPI003F9B01EA
MKFTIDRFEGNFALVELENNDIIDISVSILPEGSKEGDVLKIIIDKEETEKRKKRIEEKFKKLLEE